MINGGIAQLGEHLLCKQGVSGSIPLISTTDNREVGGSSPLGPTIPIKSAICWGPLEGLDILGGNEFRLREMLCFAKHIHAPPGASRL